MFPFPAMAAGARGRLRFIGAQHIDLTNIGAQAPAPLSTWGAVAGDLLLGLVRPSSANIGLTVSDSYLSLSGGSGDGFGIRILTSADIASPPQANVVAGSAGPNGMIYWALYRGVRTASFATAIASATSTSLSVGPYAPTTRWATIMPVIPGGAATPSAAGFAADALDASGPAVMSSTTQGAGNVALSLSSSSAVAAVLIDIT